MAYAERLALIRKIEGIRKSRVICYLTSIRQGVYGQMADDVVPEIFDQLLEFKEGSIDKLDLFLCSNGGDSTLPWSARSCFPALCKVIFSARPFSCI